MRLRFPDPKNMVEFKIIEKAKENESFREMILKKKDITKLVIADIHHRINGSNPNHVIIQITGETGSGKSHTGITFAKKYICPDMTVGNITFTAESVIEKCKELKKNTIVIMDEQKVGNTGTGGIRESMELRNLEEITRKFKLSFLFMSPTERQHLTAHYNFELFYTDRKNFTNWLALHEDDKYIGYIKIKIDPKDPLWLEYDAEDGIKNKFIEAYLDRKVGRLDYEGKVKEVLKSDKLNTLLERNGYVKTDEIMYVIGQVLPSITQTERKELMQEMKISNPEVFSKS